MATGPYPGDALQRLQAAEEEILEVVARLCEAHGLTYFIDGGTCLGAVRHGGFIPWDDDVDVALPYEDYLRFLEIACTQLPDGYSLHTMADTPGMTVLWAKVFKDGTRFMNAEVMEGGGEQGIFIDVFCYRQLDSDGRVRRRQRKRSTFWQRAAYLHGTAHPRIPSSAPLRPVLAGACVVAHALISRLWSKDRIRRNFERSWRGEHPCGEWVNDCYAARNHPCKDATLFPTKPLAFNGRMYAGPHDTDAYLHDIYGDWRRLPPEEERYTHLPLVLDFGDGINVMEDTPSAS